MEFFLVLAAVMGAFYFILLRPVISQQRSHRKDISSLEIGDEVLTAGGFFATVKEINTFEDRPMEIVLEAAPGVMLRGTTQAIQSVARRRLADEEPDIDEVDDEEDEEEDDWEEDEDWDDDDWDEEEIEEEDLEDWDEDDDWEEDDWEEEDDEESRLQLTQRSS
jgi:preprotein translocase YajC subunit